VSFAFSNIGSPAHQIGLLAETARLEIIDHYHRNFDFRIAKSDEDKRQAFKLRYQVYCEETGYLNKSDNPFGLESDAHDDHSLHSVLMHRSSNQVAGTVRMVMPRPSAHGCAQPARLFSSALNGLSDAVLPRATTGEISRFVIHPSFRCRKNSGQVANLFSQASLLSPGSREDARFDLRHMMPHMKMGLFASIFEIAREHGITHICAVIDRALLRMLTSLGLHFTKAGPPIDFHGMRQPVYASYEDLFKGMEDHQSLTESGNRWSAMDQMSGLLQHREQCAA
jgi:N-acyl amino acid synthase of PEP-CTERM/exosortase system